MVCRNRATRTRGLFMQRVAAFVSDRSTSRPQPPPQPSTCFSRQPHTRTHIHTAHQTCIHIQWGEAADSCEGKFPMIPKKRKTIKLRVPLSRGDAGCIFFVWPPLLRVCLLRVAESNDPRKHSAAGKRVRERKIRTTLDLFFFFFCFCTMRPERERG